MNPENMNGNAGFVTGDEVNSNQPPVGNTLETANPAPVSTVPQPDPTPSTVPETPVTTIPQPVDNTPQEVVDTTPIANATEVVNPTPVVADMPSVAPQSPEQAVPQAGVDVAPATNATEVVNPIPATSVPEDAPSTAPDASTLTSSVTDNTLQEAPTESMQPVDPKQSKCKKIFIIAAVILVLTVVGVVVGILFFDKFGAKNENTTEPTSTTDNTAISANVINNVDVEAQDLSNALKLLGISEVISTENVDALTFYVTNENYRDNAKDIITYYAILGSDMTSSFEGDADSYKTDKGACADTEGCAIISKANAEAILKLYGFSGELKDYFYKSEKNDNVYGIHYGNTLVLPQFDGNNLGIGHNLTAKYIGDKDIDIEDSQVFNYNDDENQLKSVNRTVKYTFKKDNENNYHLDSVLINE